MRCIMLSILWLFLQLGGGSPALAIEKLGPGSGSGNDASLANFYLRGNLAFDFLAANSTLPIEGNLPSKPIVEVWRELQDGRIKIFAVTQPIYEQGVRVDSLNRPAERISYVDWKFVHSNANSLAFRVALAHLAARDGRYADQGQLLSNALAEATKFIEGKIERLPFRQTNLTASPATARLFSLLRRSLPKSRQPWRVIDLFELSCTRQAGNHRCESQYNWVSSKEKLDRIDFVTGSQAKLIFDTLTAQGFNPTAILGGEEIRISRLVCKKNSEVSCEVDQTPRVWPSALGQGLSTGDEITDEILSEGLGAIRKIGREAMLELEKGNLFTDDGQPIPVRPLIEKWREVEAGLIRLEMSNAPLFDAEGSLVDVVTYPDRKLTIFSRAEWGYDSQYMLREKPILQMIYHELCRYLEKDQAAYRDYGYRLSQALANQTIAAVITSFVKKNGHQVQVPANAATRLFDLLKISGAPVGIERGIESIAMSGLWCSTSVDKKIECRASRENGKFRPDPQLSLYIFDLLREQKMVGVFSEIDGTEAISVIVNELRCARRAGSSIDCQLLQYLH